MRCTHCSQSFSIDKINQQRGKKLNAQIQCPLCQAWLGKSALLARLKIAGFYICFIAIACGYYWPGEQSVTIPVSILAGILLLVSHMMDHLTVIEAPQRTDDAVHRQKYR